MVKKTSESKEECIECPSICCKNLAMAIGRPVNKQEVEELKWQLHFDTVKVYIRHRRWHLWVKGRCMYLSKNNRCKIYAQRPDMCKKHNPPSCERFGKFYDIMISTPDELEKYLELKKKLSKGKKKK